MSRFNNAFHSSLNWHSLVPPFWLFLLLTSVAGGLFGFGGFTFTYARGYSYLSDDPAACANCHIMRDEYDGWNHGSHKAIATCNDCHTPHDLLGHYAIKALDGWNHSKAFTTGDFTEPIRINSFDRGITLQNCLRCHGDVTALMNHQYTADPTDCLHCHAGVGHGK